MEESEDFRRAYERASMEIELEQLRAISRSLQRLATLRGAEACEDEGLAARLDELRDEWRARLTSALELEHLPDADRRAIEEILREAGDE